MQYSNYSQNNNNLYQDENFDLDVIDMRLDWNDTTTSDYEVEVHLDNISDGLIYSLRNLGMADIEYISIICDVSLDTAIENSKCLNGYVMCLDAKLYGPIPINEFDIKTFNAIGGGGTSFIKFFGELDLIKSKMEYRLDLIIFLTDGLDDFPHESLSQNIPVLWIINNDAIIPPKEV